MAESVYAKNFILKGGILITSLVGVSMRSTMDIDTSIRGFTLSQEEVLRVVTEISEIDLEDGVIFSVKSVSGIMDEMDYPGIRLALDACMGAMVTPIKIDISTGDVITPEAVKYDYKLMFEERSILVWSYNLETILAEKLQTVMSRGVLNTRMRDYYDIYTLMLRYENEIGRNTLQLAFDATCRKRGTTDLTTRGAHIFDYFFGAVIRAIFPIHYIAGKGCRRWEFGFYAVFDRRQVMNLQKYKYRSRPQHNCI